MGQVPWYGDLSCPWYRPQASQSPGHLIAHLAEPCKEQNGSIEVTKGLRLGHQHSIVCTVPTT